MIIHWNTWKRIVLPDKPAQCSLFQIPNDYVNLAIPALIRAYPKWYVIVPFVLWSGAVGYSRMYLGVHNPSDVIAGAALGAGTAFGFGFLRP